MTGAKETAPPGGAAGSSACDQQQGSGQPLAAYAANAVANRAAPTRSLLSFMEIS